MDGLVGWTIYCISALSVLLATPVVISS